MNTKLIALDLDGTLLTSDKTLSSRNRAALDAAAARGIWIVPTTGRLFSGMPAVIRELPYVRYAITVNGGQVEDRQKILHTAYLPLPLALEIFDELDKLDVAYDCYLDGQAYMSRRFLERIEYYIPDDLHNLEMVRRLRRPLEDFRGFLLQENRPLQKLQFFLRDAGRRPALMAMLQARFPATSVTCSMPHNVEINDRDAVKGKGLQFLCGYLGITRAESLAFGDGLNDVSMLEAAGVGVVMQNGVPAALAAADRVTASNDEDGVAQFLEEYVISAE
ncbi:MAG: Cof-type HAD-IIB family hydrolase [Oscillospiraceae bacterium]|nr:Cof-type HAD-IIB family hydrolase [Oscillospiraceae bacterium]